MALGLHSGDRVKWGTYILAALAFLAFARSASAIETEIIPCVVRRMSDEKPHCCLKRNDREFVLYVGQQELKRFTHSLGANMNDHLPVYDQSLKLSLETVLLLRQTNVCQ